MDIKLDHIPIDYIALLEKDFNIRWGILRLDVIHPEISGNKWFKLQEQIREAQRQHCDTIITFGGAYSNHLIATAVLCHHLGLKCIGIVRGLHGKAVQSPTIEACTAYGMQLHFVSRVDYRLKDDLLYHQHWLQQYPGSFIVPEGGDNIYGRIGIADIAQYIPSDVNIVTTAIGSGTTCAGLISSLPINSTVWGFTAFKEGAYMQNKIAASLPESHCNWEIFTAYHFGGFAKHNVALIDFMNDFYQKTQIPLDFVYTAKMIYGVLDLVARNSIRDKHIISVHTGGLQGNSSLAGQLSWM
jgi:1-aminocyclopropane-1-carboxylate deaminase